LVAVRQQTIAGRYELKHVLGTGGMSSVYSAFDTLLERNVALKILHDQYGDDEEYVERFRREARSVAQLSHPNIVTVIDRGEEEGKQFIVFEVVEGENLKELVERGGPLPVRRALELGLEVGRALAFAHGQGLVHRDVKPQNVLLDGDGRAKVTDFGIARTLDAVGQTETGTVLGTSHYIAPEQARGERIDAETDVYSFGVVLFELLTGDVPYPGDNFLTVAMKHVNEPIPNTLDRRPDTPLRLASLIESCMAKLPADRPSSMDVVVAELEACLAELDAKGGGEGTMIMKRPKPAAKPKAAARPPKQSRQRSGRFSFPVLPALVALLLLAAVAGGIYLATSGGEPGTAAGSGAVTMSGVGAYDPDGGDGEHDDLAALATDGDPGTFWRTSTYRSQLSAFKSGVGLVLKASGTPKQIAVTTDTPGFTAEVQAGDSPQGPFKTVAGAKVVESTTTWDLDGTNAQYYVIWITQLVGSAHVNEVKAT
jgi:serine/threonine-protein kinase